jgi:hypothetical protein
MPSHTPGSTLPTSRPRLPETRPLKPGIGPDGGGGVRLARHRDSLHGFRLAAYRLLGSRAAYRHRERSNIERFLQVWQAGFASGSRERPPTSFLEFHLHRDVLVRRAEPFDSSSSRDAEIGRRAFGGVEAANGPYMKTFSLEILLQPPGRGPTAIACRRSSLGLRSRPAPRDGRGPNGEERLRTGVLWAQKSVHVLSVLAARSSSRGRRGSVPTTAASRMTCAVRHGVQPRREHGRSASPTREPQARAWVVNGPTMSSPDRPS